MSSSEQLSKNIKQHCVKNKESQISDKQSKLALMEVKVWLEEKFDHLLRKRNYKLIWKRSISFKEMIEMIKRESPRSEFTNKFNQRTIQPDAGLLILEKNNESDWQKIILTAEMKRQGTNDKRKQEGKAKQSQGNAIERLGKNLIGIKTATNYENVTPFICFGSGCDFADPEGFVMSKIVMLNQFYELNRSYVFKRDYFKKHHFDPVSMYFRKNSWTQAEMVTIMKEVAESVLRVYLY